MRCIITMHVAYVDQKRKTQTSKIKGPKKKEARLTRMIGRRLNRYCQPRRICNGTLGDRGKNDPSLLLCPHMSNDRSLLLQWYNTHLFSSFGNHRCHWPSSIWSPVWYVLISNWYIFEVVRIQPKVRPLSEFGLSKKFCATIRRSSLCW